MSTGFSSHYLKILKAFLYSTSMPHTFFCKWIFLFDCSIWLDKMTIEFYKKMKAKFNNTTDTTSVNT